MSHNLKIQKFKTIIIKKFCQKINVCYFCYINCKRQSHSGRFLCIVNARLANLWCFVNQGLCHLCSVANTTENFSETKFRKKKSKFLVYGKTHYHTIFVYGKMLIIEFSYNFLYVWNCMKLYDKKFLIYGNYMIRSFGQPG